MKRRLIYGLVAVVLAVNLGIGARIYLSSAAAAEKDSAYPNLELFSRVMETVRKDYVDGQKLTYQELVYGALKGMVDTLDPHSEFLDPEKYKELQNDTQGAFGGLGIVISMKDSFITVVAPMEDSPASKRESSLATESSRLMARARRECRCKMRSKRSAENRARK